MTKPLITVVLNEEFGRVAGDAVIDEALSRLRTAPERAITIIPPTGNTPTPVYNYWAERTGEMSGLTKLWDSIRFQQLDERVGENAFRDAVLDLAEKLSIPENRLMVIDGKAADIKAEEERYRSLVAANPADIICLGMGAHDGHIAFNQPYSALDSVTRLVDLSDATQSQQQAYGDGASADQGLTQGLHELLFTNPNASIFGWVTGANKAGKLAEAMNGKIDIANPFSTLRLAEGRLHIIADQEAASGLIQGHENYDLEFAVQ